MGGQATFALEGGWTRYDQAGARSFEQHEDGRHRFSSSAGPGDEVLFSGARGTGVPGRAGWPSPFGSDTDASTGDEEETVGPEESPGKRTDVGTGAPGVEVYEWTEAETAKLGADWDRIVSEEQ